MSHPNINSLLEKNKQEYVKAALKDCARRKRQLFELMEQKYRELAWLQGELRRLDEFTEGRISIFAAESTFICNSK